MKLNKSKIIDLRNQQRWTQEDLAAATGVSVRTIQRVESEGVGSLETGKAIAAAFDTDLITLSATDWEWRHVRVFLKPFWPLCGIGFVIAMIGALLVVRGLISEPSAAYWAGAMVSTMTFIWLYKVHEIYKDEFGG